MSQRTLILMRHAKSAYPVGVDDHDRPLNPRGERQATATGAWLQQNFGKIDTVLCSSAVRTRATLARADVQSGRVVFSDALYDSTTGTVLAEINGVDNEARTILVIGHEPVTSQLALALADSASSDADAARRISLKFPTSAAAVLTTASLWSALELGGATLRTFYIPD